MLSKHNLEDYTFRRGLSVLKLLCLYGIPRNLKLVCLDFYNEREESVVNQHN